VHRPFIGISTALLVALDGAPVRAASDGAAEARPLALALGVKTGFIPPVLAAPELVLHGPHFFLGAFGIATGGGMGNGGARFTLGGDLGYELAQAGRSTPYLLGSFLHYTARTDASGFSERSDLLTITAGYEWKGEHLELQLGAGALFILHDQVPPCAGWFCGFMSAPPVLPALDLSLRYRL
jgi:hypothetical protein